MENIFKPPTILLGKASQRRFTTRLLINPPEETKVIKKGRDYVNFFMQQEEKLYEVTYHLILEPIFGSIRHSFVVRLVLTRFSV